MSEQLPVGTISFQVYQADPGKVSKHSHRESYISLDYPIYASFTKTIELLADFGIKPSYWSAEIDAITEITGNEYNRYAFASANNQQLNANRYPTAATQNADRNTLYPLNETPLQRTENTVTYYYPENKERATIYRGAEDIERLMGSSYSEMAFGYNSFIRAEPNTMLSVCYLNSYGGETYATRYQRQ